MDSSVLNQEQQEKLLNAFAQVAVLIGMADGKMDDDEMSWSKKIANIRSFSGHEELFGFYQQMNEEIGGRINNLLNKYSNNLEKREQEIVSELSNVNEVLSSLPAELGAHIYKDLRTFSKHIAKASGGFLRFFSVGPNEKKWIKLPMINEIIWEGVEE